MSKPLRIGVIGAGHWGPNLIRCFEDSSLSHVTQVCDADSERLKLLKTTYPKLEVTSHWKDVCQNKELDAVVVSTPTATHYPIVREALEKGKHVFVEKPLCTSSKEGEVLVELARQKGLKLFVGHVFLFNSGIRYLKRMIAAGELGDILYFSATRTNLGPIRGDVNALWDLASHDIAVLLYLLDEVPESVTAFGSSYINPPVEDVVFAGLRFKNNILAALHCSWLDPKKVRQLLVVGSKKMAVFDDMNPEESIRIYDKNVGPVVSQSTIMDNIFSFRKSIVEGASHAPRIEYSQPLKEECEAFLNWVIHDLPQPSTPALALNVVSTLERLTQAMTPEALSPKNHPIHSPSLQAELSP